MTARKEMTGCDHSVSSHMNDQGTKRQVLKVLSPHDLTRENRERLPKRWWENQTYTLKNKQQQQQKHPAMLKQQQQQQKQTCSLTALWKGFQCEFGLQGHQCGYCKK